MTEGCEVKVLYAAMYHDPRLLDISSSVDNMFYSALQENGFDITICGPF